MKKLTYKCESRVPAGKRKGKRVETWFRRGKVSSTVTTKWTKNWRP